tara:strand:+ start:1180 stop:1506 length:327 start_codon:yes stop_codon:yes gene_type:complete
MNDYLLPKNRAKIAKHTLFLYPDMSGKDKYLDKKHVFSWVERNHCGLPWPVDVDGNEYVGCVQIRQRNSETYFADMQSGKRLSDKELENRKNNQAFDYFTIHGPSVIK